MDKKKGLIGHLKRISYSKKWIFATIIITFSVMFAILIAIWESEIIKDMSVCYIPGDWGSDIDNVPPDSEFELRVIIKYGEEAKLEKNYQIAVFSGKTMQTPFDFENVGWSSISDEGRGIVTYLIKRKAAGSNNLYTYSLDSRSGNATGIRKVTVRTSNQ